MYRRTSISKPNIFQELVPKKCLKREKQWGVITRCCPDLQRFVAQALHEPKKKVPYLHALHRVLFVFFFSINLPTHLLNVFTV